MVALVPVPGQLPLIQFVESDDLYFQDQPDVLWFDVLPNLDDRRFQATAAHYYECLWQFNRQQAQQRNDRRENPPPPNEESRRQATQRLIFSRPTLDQNAAVLYQPPASPRPEISIRPQSLHPGVTPPRFAGRPPKCFFALLKSFLGLILAGQSPEPEFVYQKLRANPAFARTCGFTIPRPGKPSRQSDIPSLRKLQQFDQIMTENGLWAELALDQVADNLRNGTVRAESTIVHDTTHYHAYSTMKVVALAPTVAATPTQVATETSSATEVRASQQPNRVTVGGPAVVVGRVPVVRVRLDTLDDEAQRAYWTNKSAEMADAQSAELPSSATQPQESGRKAKAKTKTKAKKAKKAPKEKRKSHPRTTKNCRCADRAHCDHPWINADEGAGTVVKSTGKMSWAHKASTLSFADQEVLLDAVALNDAASHDSQSVVPHLGRLFARHPDLKGVVKRLLDDGAADDPELKAETQATFHMKFDRGDDRLTKRGTPSFQARLDKTLWAMHVLLAHDG